MALGSKPTKRQWDHRKNGDFKFEDWKERSEYHDSRNRLTINTYLTKRGHNWKIRENSVLTPSSCRTDLTEEKSGCDCTVKTQEQGKKRAKNLITWIISLKPSSLNSHGRRALALFTKVPYMKQSLILDLDVNYCRFHFLNSDSMLTSAEPNFETLQN